jgi:hypothetical protein
MCPILLLARIVEFHGRVWMVVGWVGGSLQDARFSFVNGGLACLENVLSGMLRIGYGVVNEMV